MNPSVIRSKWEKIYSSRNFGAQLKDENVYEDEGYSGGTTDRPKFKLMMENMASWFTIRLRRKKANHTKLETTLNSASGAHPGVISADLSLVIPLEDTIRACNALTYLN
ncbi:hypothetical protein DOT_1670 [Desulfosporosinus sp. OT]|nr:hypothetical protein DOT_1670 [Desulfosporosinus sp. OT]